MKLEVFDKDTRERIGMIKSYQFSQRINYFNDVGTFTIKIPYIEGIYSIVKKGNFVLFEDDEIGIIKYIYKIIGKQNTIQIKGFYCKKILNYRVFEKTKNYDGTKTDVARQMVADLIINPSLSKRKIDYIKLSEDLKYIPESDNVTLQVTGDNLDIAISDMLNEIDYGWDLVPKVVNYDESTDNPTNIESLDFRVIKPTDRTIGNPDGNTPIVFSMDLNNLSEIISIEDDELYCSTAFVAGEGEGAERIVVEAGDTEVSGIDRIELYTDARDLKSKDSDGNVITQEQYNQKLVQRGNEDLIDYKSFNFITGLTVPGDFSFKYKKDYFNGDFVSVIDEQTGMQINIQITAVTISNDESGELIDLTFGYEKATMFKLLERKGVI